jgi:hypothetical protein
VVSGDVVEAKGKQAMWVVCRKGNRVPKLADFSMAMKEAKLLRRAKFETRKLSKVLSCDLFRQHGVVTRNEAG